MEKTDLQLLVSAMHENPRELAQKMNLSSDAIIINQTDVFAYDSFEHKGYSIQSYSFAERGVGLSRNNALLRADHAISLFADEDIVYRDSYREAVLGEFEKHPEADVLLFHVEVAPARRTYSITQFGRVRLYNCGRYPTYSFAVRTERIHRKNITFSLLFGGGAKYSNGEDSLFLQECIKKGLRVYKTPVIIGRELERKSTWFAGYNDKFFFDRGVLYVYLYGRLAEAMALRFLWKNKEVMCREIALKQAFDLMRQGIREGRKR